MHIHSRRTFIASAGAAVAGFLTGLKAIEGQITGDSLKFVSLPDPLAKGSMVWDPSSLGYVVEEYLVSGNGPTFAPSSAVEAGIRDRPDTTQNWGTRDQAYAGGLPADFSARPQTGTAAYTTRIIFYRPRDIRKFSGNVILEPMHSSGHIEVFSVANRFLLTRGDAVVHVELPGRFNALKKLSSDRYGALNMPDRTSFWTSVSQLATAMKAGSTNSLLPRPARHMYLTGYSGSADTVYIFLSYHHRLTRMADGSPVFDGYLPMSHIRPAPPVDAVIVSAATQSDMFGATSGDSAASRAFRRLYNSDLPSARRRRYEVPGAFHGPLERAEPGMAIPSQEVKQEDAGLFATCATSQKWPSEAEPNNFPNRAIIEACFYHASRWVEKGIVPPTAPLIETDANDIILTDENGNARGGLRFPDISVPTDTFTPATRGELTINSCRSTGYKLPFSREKLVALYGSREHYLSLYDAAAEKLVAEGFILPEGAAQMTSDRRWLAPVF